MSLFYKSFFGLHSSFYFTRILSLVTLLVYFGFCNLTFCAEKNYARFFKNIPKVPVADVEGYHKEIAGKKINYTSILGRRLPALIANPKKIEWETSPVPQKLSSENVVFLWESGIGCNFGDLPFTLEINRKYKLKFTTSPKWNWEVDNQAGCKLAFIGLSKDRNKDLFGYMVLSIPAKILKPGKPVVLKIFGQGVASRAWVMAFKSPDALTYFKNNFYKKALVECEVNQKDGLLIQAKAPIAWKGRKLDVMLNNQQIGRIQLDAINGVSYGKFTYRETSSRKEDSLQLSYQGKIVGSKNLKNMSAKLLMFNTVASKRDALLKTYGIGRPLDKMNDASKLVRRHRGMVALIFMLLDNKCKYKKSDKNELLMLLTKMLKELDQGKNYLKNMRNEFWSAYYCPADSSGQPFVTTVPENYDPMKKYPLVVALHGSGGRPKPNFGKKFNGKYLMVQPWGRGDLAYEGLADYDVMRIIEYMKEWYNIDSSRIYITGGSMGGRGTWGVATRHPDTFAAAAPICGWADGLSLENLKNIPIFNQHGQKDWTVSIDQSRFAVDQLQKRGYSIAHKEFPEAGHSIANKYPVIDWLLTFQKPKKTLAVVYSCQNPEWGKAYWTSILKFINPHKQATVIANFAGFGPQQLLTVKLNNVEVLAIDTTSAPVDKNNDLIVQVGKDQFIRKAPLPDTFYISNQQNKIALLTHWQAEKSAIRSYSAGAAADLYTGEPILIVYGTGGDDKQNQVLKKAAKRLSTHGAYSWVKMSLGQIPIKIDKDVTYNDIQNNNIILLGSAKENSLVAKMFDKFPLRINAKNELIVEDRKPLTLD